MNYKTRPLYELCYDCKETFDTACHICFTETIHELQSEDMMGIIKRWNRKDILKKLSVWLKNKDEVENFTFAFYRERNLTIKVGGKQDLLKKQIIPGVKEWMCENPIENIYIIEESIKSVKIITV